MDYIVFVDYFSDAERKRIDYAVERWRGKADVSKPKGTAILFHNQDIDGFLEDLCSRLDSGWDQVRVFEAAPYEPDMAAQRETLQYHSAEPGDMIRKFLGYVMAKINAQYEQQTGDVMLYSASTKKGQARIEIRVTDTENGSDTVVTVSGYGKAGPFVRDRIDEELRTFLGE